jgi:hypothetical protein
MLALGDPARSGAPLNINYDSDDDDDQEVNNNMQVDSDSDLKLESGDCNNAAAGPSSYGQRDSVSCRRSLMFVL